MENNYLFKEAEGSQYLVDSRKCIRAVQAVERINEELIRLSDVLKEYGQSTEEKMQRGILSKGVIFFEDYLRDAVRNDMAGSKMFSATIERLAEQAVADIPRGFVDTISEILRNIREEERALAVTPKGTNYRYAEGRLYLSQTFIDKQREATAHQIPADVLAIAEKIKEAAALLDDARRAGFVVCSYATVNPLSGKPFFVQGIIEELADITEKEGAEALESPEKVLNIMASKRAPRCPWKID